VLDAAGAPCARPQFVHEVAATVSRLPRHVHLVRFTARRLLALPALCSIRGRHHCATLLANLGAQGNRFRPGVPFHGHPLSPLLSSGYPRLKGSVKCR
jgi:hypothetical protein